MPNAVRRLALGSTILTVALITVGGVVRATGSGLGCPGWPRCFGRWIPPLEYHAIIEYTHRLVTSVVVLVIAGFAFSASAFARHERRVFLPAVAALFLVVFQAGLGAIVVRGELESVLVTAHFATAMILLGVLTYASVAAVSTRSVTAARPPLGTFAWATAGALFVLLVLWAYVRGEGASLAFRDWPLMDGRLVPALDSFRATLHFLHRVVALVVAGLVVLLALRGWRNRSANRAGALLSVALLGAFLAQVLVGAADVWSRLAPAAVATHVGLAGVIWSLAVATGATMRADRQPDQSLLQQDMPELVRQG
jgi:heme A synthase